MTDEYRFIKVGQVLFTEIAFSAGGFCCFGEPDLKMKRKYFLQYLYYSQ